MRTFGGQVESAVSGEVTVRYIWIVVLVLGLVCSAAADAAAPAPDAQDRAAANALVIKVTDLQRLSAASRGGDDRITKALEGCKGLGKAPAQGFAVVFAMLPVMLIDLVNQIRPQLLDVRATLVSIRPHAPLFRSWVAAQRTGIDEILALDNHGKRVDYCAAARVMLAKNPSDARVKAVLGVPLSRIETFFAGGSSKAQATVSNLNPRMRVFLVAAGVPRSVAVRLTK